MPLEVFTLYAFGIGGCALAQVAMLIGTRGYRNHSAANSCLMTTLSLIIMLCAVGVTLLCCGSVQGALACFVTVILTGVMWLAGALVYLWVVV